MADFPLILSVVDDRRRARIQDAIRDLEDAPNGGIANPKYVEAKSLVNDVLDKAWDKTVNENFSWGGRWKELPEVVSDAITYVTPTAHTMAGVVKKIEKAKAKAGDHAVFAATDAYFKEALPLAKLLNDAKELIIKRQPKAASETPKERYSKPLAADSAIEQVKALLIEITKQGRAELERSLTAQYNRYMDVFFKRQEDAIAESGKRFAPYDAFRASRSSINMDAYEVVSACTKEVRVEDSRAKSGMRSKYVKEDDADQQIASRVTKVADEIEEAFVYKNLAKIDTIVSAKGDYASGKLISHRIGSGLEGRIRFEFKDGAAFTVQNSVVYSHSVHGTPFMRYPLTFHDVLMPGGVEMPQPSEKRMNTVWLGMSED